MIIEKFSPASQTLIEKACRIAVKLASSAGVPDRSPQFFRPCRDKNRHAGIKTGDPYGGTPKGSA